MRNVVITGSASGIGLAAKLLLEEQGDRVIGIDIQDADIIADLATVNGRNLAIEKSLELCDGAIDSLILSAGLSGMNSDGETTISVNYFGTVELLDGLYSAMVGRPNPCVVCLVSNASRFVQYDDPIIDTLFDGDEDKCRKIFKNLDKGAGYRYAKHAIARLIRHRATEWAPSGVRITACVPGMTDTPMVDKLKEDPELGPILETVTSPMGRRGTPEEMAGIIAFLLSDAASFITGTMIWADGGLDAQDNPNIF